MDIARGQNGDNKEAQCTQHHTVIGKLTDSHQGIRVRHNNTGVFQPHHGDKQPDTTGDTDPQTQRDMGNQPVTDAQ